MASAAHIADVAPARHAEIREWHASLATRSDSEIMGLGRGASPAELKAAFAALARRFHPDSAPPGDAHLQRALQAIFVRITEAYRNLSERASHEARRPAPREVPAPRMAPRDSDTPRPSAPRRAPTPASDAASRRARVDEALRTAEELISRQRTEEAVTTLHEVLTQADGLRRRRIRLLLAQAYAVDPHWRRHAVALLRELVEENSADAEALTALGSLYQREGLLSRAEPMFARALAADPGLASARAGLRAVRAALAAKHTPDATTPGPRRGLIRRLFSVAR